MLHKRHNSSVVTLAILVTLVGVLKPAQAFLLAQANEAPKTFTLPEKLPGDSELKIAASNSTSSISEGLKEGFASKYPQAKIEIAPQDSITALQSLEQGEADLVAIGRNLTADEKAQGFVAVPISREKIAIVISKDNPFSGNLTIDQFAQIFRGEITNWSDVGGNAGDIQVVDLPESNDTRQAFPGYPVFQSAEFVAGSNALTVEQDDLETMVAQLGEQGIGYAVANDVMERDDVKVVSMHQTLPDNQKYPFSQPFSLVYKGSPSEAAQAYIGFATAKDGEQVLANRVGSLPTAAAVAVASGLGKRVNANSNEIAAPEQEQKSLASTNANSNEQESADPTAEADQDSDLAAGSDPNADLANQDQGAESVASADLDNKDKPTDNEIVDSEKRADQIASADLDTKEGKASQDADKLLGADSDGVDGDSGDSNNKEVKAPGAESGIKDVDLKDSGAVNSDVVGSGDLNAEVEGSGEIDPDAGLQDSGIINPEIEGSGEINPDVSESGELNPDIKDSGAPLKAEGETTTGEAVAQNETAENSANANNVVTKKGKWWWWLPLLLGVPLLGALFTLGGRKKSDQEPAISNIPNIDNPDGGMRVSGGSGGEVSAVGANAVGNAAKIGGVTMAAGGAAVAGGASAAAANLADNRSSVVGETELNLELDESIDGIPSNPVSEFTGQDTKLQIDDAQATELQEAEDTELSDTNIGGDFNPPLGTFGDAAITGNEGIIDADFNVKADVDAPNLNIASPSSEVGIGQEFTGDFVLEEEATDIASDVDANTNILDGISNAGGAAIAGGAAAVGGAAAAASGFFNREQDTDNPIDAEYSAEGATEIDVPGADLDVDLGGTVEGIDVPDIDLGGTVDGVTGKVGDAVDNISTPDLNVDLSGAVEGINVPDVNVPNIDVPDVNLPDVDISGTVDNVTGKVGDVVGGVQAPDVSITGDVADAGSNIVDGVKDAGGAAIAGGAAAIGGAAAAASGFFNRESDTEEDTEINVPNIDVPDVDLGGTVDSVTGKVGDAVDNISTPDLNVDLGGTVEDATGAVTGAVEGINVPDVNVPDIDVPDVNLPDVDVSGTVDNVTGKVGDVVGEVQAPDVSITGDVADAGSNIVDDVKDAGGAAIAGGAAAIGGVAAAASGFFNRKQEDGEFTTDASLEDIDISLDSRVESLDAGLEGITFDDSAVTDELTLDSISLDEDASALNTSLDEITFDDDTVVTNNLDLDDLELNTENPSLKSNSELNVDLDTLGFTEVGSTSGEDVTVNANDAGDMENISEWLDGLETPNRETDSISEWLDNLDKGDVNLDQAKANPGQEITLDENESEISFQFLEDLLDRDADKNRDS